MAEVHFFLRPRRRLADRIRALADVAWAQGKRETAEALHEAARVEERTRSAARRPT